MTKLTIPLEKVWLVRHIIPAVGGAPELVSFWVVANQWDRSPMHATIFRSEDDAQRHIDDMRHYKRAGFSPGQIVEAVPLEGAAKSLGTWIATPDSTQD